MIKNGTRVVYETRGDSLVVHVDGEIDHHSALALREKVDRQIAALRPKELVIDLAAVDFMDSSGLGLILGRVEAASGVSATVRLTGLSPTLMKLVRLAGLERVKNLTVSKIGETEVKK